MIDADLERLSLSEAAALIADRHLSPLELTEAYISRAERLDGKLNVYVTRTFETALEEAAAATAEIANGRHRGPLHGVPFALKDLYETAGVRTTAGSKLREEYVPREDSYAVARLKDAGAVLLGKLNMHEWALGGTNINAWFGTVHNPWNLSCIAGGSSGGSGAALVEKGLQGDRPESYWPKDASSFSLTSLASFDARKSRAKLPAGGSMTRL